MKTSDGIDLLGYLPPFMAEYRELAEALRAEEPEFRLAWEGARRALDNQFVQTADAYGLAHYETLLGLPPAPGEDPDARRARILAALLRRIPYTRIWLRHWLNELVGEGGHKETLDGYSLGLWMDGKALIAAQLSARELVELLRPILPLNLDWRVEVSLPVSGTMFCGGALSKHATVYIREIPDAPNFRRGLRTGGRFGALARVEVLEDRQYPRMRQCARVNGRFGAWAQVGGRDADTQSGPVVRQTGCVRTVTPGGGR